MRSEWRWNPNENLGSASESEVSGASGQIQENILAMANQIPIRLRSSVAHPKQDAFIKSAAKRKIIRAGRRSGKTTGSAVLAVMHFLAGRRVLYATPTAEQIARFWSEIKAALEDAIRAGVFTKNETFHTI